MLCRNWERSCGPGNASSYGNICRISTERRRPSAVDTRYSEKSAASQASRLLRRPEVREYRDALLQEQFEAIGVTRHSLAAEVWEVYRRCTEKKPVLEWDSTQREWVPSGVWQFDSKGALRALEMLSRMLPGLGQEDGADSYEDLLGGQ